MIRAMAISLPIQLTLWNCRSLRVTWFILRSRIKRSLHKQTRLQDCFNEPRYYQRELYLKSQLYDDQIHWLQSVSRHCSWGKLTILNLRSTRLLYDTEQVSRLQSGTSSNYQSAKNPRNNNCTTCTRWSSIGAPSSTHSSTSLGTTLAAYSVDLRKLFVRQKTARETCTSTRHQESWRRILTSWRFCKHFKALVKFSP